MVELDGYVGQLLQRLDDLGIADETIVLFTSDNGAEIVSWPDGGATPFRGEKATNWEGGYRVPMVIRWPGTIAPGTIHNEVFAHYDLIPTFAAAAGEPDIVGRMLEGTQLGDKSFKVHLDGYDMMPILSGEAETSPHREFIYWNDDGLLVAIRYDDWKAVFYEQNHEGIGVWDGQFDELRLPKLFNLRSDPLERGDTSILYNKWRMDRAFVQVPLQTFAAEWLSSFREFPPRQKPASFNLDEVMRRFEASGPGN
jgi:arylsulfatase